MSSSQSKASVNKWRAFYQGERVSTCVQLPLPESNGHILQVFPQRRLFRRVEDWENEVRSNHFRQYSKTRYTKDEITIVKDKSCVKCKKPADKPQETNVAETHPPSVQTSKYTPAEQGFITRIQNMMDIANTTPNHIKMVMIDDIFKELTYEGLEYLKLDKFKKFRDACIQKANEFKEDKNCTRVLELTLTKFLVAIEQPSKETASSEAPVPIPEQAPPPSPVESEEEIFKRKMREMFNTMNTTHGVERRSKVVNNIYQYILDNGLKFLNTPRPAWQRLRDVTINKGYELKGENGCPEYVKSTINKVLLALEKPCEYPSGTTGRAYEVKIITREGKGSNNTIQRTCITLEGMKKYLQNFYEGWSKMHNYPVEWDEKDMNGPYPGDSNQCFLEYEMKEYLDDKTNEVFTCLESESKRGPSLRIYIYSSYITY